MSMGSFDVDCPVCHEPLRIPIFVTNKSLADCCDDAVHHHSVHALIRLDQDYLAAHWLTHTPSAG